MIKLKTINDLKSLLYEDVRKGIQIRNEINKSKTNIDLYLKLLDLLNAGIDKINNNFLNISLLISFLYSNEESNKFNLKEILYKNDINQYNILINKIKSDYELEVENLKILDSNENKVLINNIVVNKRIISALKYDQYLEIRYIRFIKLRLEKENTNSMDVLRILELINIHNKHVKRNGRKLNYQEIYSLMDIFNAGFEYIEPPKKVNNVLDNVVLNLVNVINSASIEEVLNNLNYYDNEHLKYIYSKLLIYYQDKIIDTIDVLKDNNFYFDKEIIAEIKKDYYLYLNKYLIIREFYNKLLDCKEVVKEEEKIVEDVYVNNLLFSTNSNEPEKCYFIKDLEGLREESYENIYNLLENFKKGISSKIKPLTGRDSYTWELKDDQIRIVLKPVSNNYYLVKGVFIKKSDNNQKKYDAICDRTNEYISVEYALEVEEYFKKFVNENKREGSR